AREIIGFIERHKMNLAGETGRSYLERAIEVGSNKAVAGLLASGVEPTGLYAAAKAGNIEGAKLLIEAGADPSGMMLEEMASLPGAMSEKRRDAFLEFLRSVRA